MDIHTQNLGDNAVVAARARRANEVALRLLDSTNPDTTASSLLQWFDDKRNKRHLLSTPWAELQDKGYSVSELRAAGVDVVS